MLSSQPTSASDSCPVTLGKSLPSSELVFISRKETPHLGKRRCSGEMCGAQQSGCLESGCLLS